jgi:maleate cis-trans isomerase
MSDARIGLIIPSGNRLTEPQFHRYTPEQVGVYVTRLRMTGRWRKPLSELKKDLADAAAALSDTKPGLIVFHCTANSMENGLRGEADLIETIQQASGCATITTAQAIREAFDRLRIQKLVLISPYVKETNAHEISYLTEAGFSVVHDVGLALESDQYGSVTPPEWIRIAKDNTRPDADGYFLSCTNTRMIEAVDELEKQLGKPVVNSNQATLWAALRRLNVPPAHKVGRLFN